MQKCCHPNNVCHTHEVQRLHRAIYERYGPCHGGGCGKMIVYPGIEILETMPSSPARPRIAKIYRCLSPCTVVSNPLDFIRLMLPFFSYRSHVLEKVCMYFTYKVRYTNSSTEIPEFPIEAPIALELLMAANFLDC